MYRLLRGKTKLGGDALLNVYKTLIKKQRDFEKKKNKIDTSLCGAFERCNKSKQCIAFSGCINQTNDDGRNAEEVATNSCRTCLKLFQLQTIYLAKARNFLIKNKGKEKENLLDIYESQAW